jgi:hypothetical protein
MNVFDFRDYLNFAEKQLMLAQESSSKFVDPNALLIPATILAWSAIESFVNNRLEDFGSLPETRLQLHERAFLLEKKVKLVDSGERIGQFVLEGTEYNRLEDKIFFLISKFGGRGTTKVKKGDQLWQRFKKFKDTRDALIHPRQKRSIPLSISKVQQFIDTTKDIIRLISEKVWRKKIEF